MEGKALHFLQVLGIVAAFFLVGSCAAEKMYTGPDLPVDKTARIESESAVKLESCDGKKTTYPALLVQPGKHIVEMSYVRMSGFFLDYSGDTCFLSFTAKEGHVYRVDLTPPSAGTYSGFIIDRTTGQRVASGCIVPAGMEEKKLKEVEESIKRQPDNATLWTFKGQLLVATHHYEEALAACDNAISLKPDLAVAWAWKSRSYFELKRREEALQAIDKAILLAPNEPAFVNLRNTITRVAAVQGVPKKASGTGKEVRE